MKKFGVLLVFSVFLTGSALRAQQPDTSKIRIGKKQYTVIVDDDKEIRIITDDDANIVVQPKHKKHHRPVRRMDGTWDGLEFGLTNFMNSNHQLQLPDDGQFLDLKMGNSWGVNFNFAEKSFGLIQNYFGLVTGLSLEYQRYMFSGDFDLVKTQQGITAAQINYDLYKNRLSVCHLVVPLLVEFQIPVYGEHERIKVSAGVVGGLRIGARQVQKYMENDEKQKIKSRDDFYLRDYRYGFTARVGYGDFAIFSTYYPQTLFEDGKGPQVFPVTFGVHFGE
ncbi:MAG: hypothetical protein J7L89_08950 [Bacteroidales bacterium]|nr:hypothetical protein [Bacteroidales bacterium]